MNSSIHSRPLFGARVFFQFEKKPIRESSKVQRKHHERNHIVEVVFNLAERNAQSAYGSYIKNAKHQNYQAAKLQAWKI